MKKRLVVLLSVFCAVSMFTVAQDYDDIYFNSSKTKKKETKKNTYKKQSPSDYYKFSDNDDFVEIENNRDIDEYNRRYVTRDTTQIDSAMVDDYTDFAYTDRIQRFHNPSVVDEANDRELAELYNDSKASTVTIIVSPNTLSPNWAWGVGYSSWTYGWSSPVYSPWYYDWTWGWSGWNWYRNHHHYNHHFHNHHWCGPIYHGPVYGGGINQIVTSRPNNMGGGGRRPFGTSYRNDKSNRHSGTSINKGSQSSTSVRTSGRRPSVGRSVGSSIVNRSTGSSGSYRRSSTSRSSSYSAPPAASSSYSRSSSSSNSGSRGGSYSGGGGGSRSNGSSGGRR